MESFLRHSFSYDKLPAFPIRLSVLKLDGSSFDVRIKTSDTVGDLKVAIEETFDHVPKEGPAKISWPHVWGHFCLSFKGQKLVTDTDYISGYGVEDGDQIQFVRNVSGNAEKGYWKRSKQQRPSELLLGLKIQKFEETMEYYSWADLEKGSFEASDRLKREFALPRGK